MPIWSYLLLAYFLFHAVDTVRRIGRTVTWTANHAAFGIVSSAGVIGALFLATPEFSGWGLALIIYQLFSMLWTPKIVGTSTKITGGVASVALVIYMIQAALVIAATS